MEVWDAYYEDGSLAGCDLIRGEYIPEGLFHLVSNVIVRHVDGDFLLMQRDYNKKIYPGMYEATVTGGALKGERSEECARRELKEETGLDGASLQFICKCTDKLSKVLFYIFLCEVDCDKSSVILQEGETISYRWMSQEKFVQFIETDRYIHTDKENKQPYFDTL